MGATELVRYIAAALVDHPDAVSVTEEEGEEGTVLALRVASDDLGKVIGRQGRTARAIRTLLGVVTGDGPPVRLEIVE